MDNPTIIHHGPCTATLYLGDCLEVLPTLEDNSVDCVITDPPYGMKWMPRVRNRREIIGDDKPFDPSFLLNIGKTHIIWGVNHFATKLPDCPSRLLWLKHDPGLFGKRNTSPFELAFWDGGNKACKAIKHIWDGYIKEGVAHNSFQEHPAQKPVEVMSWCVSLTEGTVLDPFMGSGTTGVAALKLGRNFIGIEIDPEYFEIAVRRIRDVDPLFAELKE